MAASLAARTLARPSFEAAFAAPAFLRAMLAFEAALGRAQADEGVIPAASAHAIEAACAGLVFDVDAVVAEAKRSATLAVPLARLLKAAVAEAQASGLAIQLGGPVGALEALGAKGPAVRHRMAMALGLADVPAWHVHRNAWIDLLGRIGQAVLTLGKIARDVALLSQPEVGEMLEAPPSEDAGRSSAMPHKRNPVACAHALAAATRMPGLLATLHAAALGEHERALGGWQAELALVPEIAGAYGSALDFAATVGSSLVLNPGRMAQNLAAYGEGAHAPHLADETDALLATLRLP